MWDVMSFSLKKGYLYFRDTLCLHLQDRREYSNLLKMEVEVFSETLVPIYQGVISQKALISLHAAVRT